MRKRNRVLVRRAYTIGTSKHHPIGKSRMTVYLERKAEIEMMMKIEKMKHHKL